MSSKFGEIWPWAKELAALERLKKIPKTYNGENDVITLSLLFFILSFFILAGNEDMHKCLDDFEIGPDLTTGSMTTDSVII